MVNVCRFRTISRFSAVAFGRPVDVEIGVFEAGCPFEISVDVQDVVRDVVGEVLTHCGNVQEVLSLRKSRESEPVSNPRGTGTRTRANPRKRLGLDQQGDMMVTSRCGKVDPCMVFDAHCCAVVGLPGGGGLFGVRRWLDRPHRQQSASMRSAKRAENVSVHARGEGSHEAANGDVCCCVDDKGVVDVARGVCDASYRRVCVCGMWCSHQV